MTSLDWASAMKSLGATSALSMRSPSEEEMAALGAAVDAETLTAVGEDTATVKRAQNDDDSQTAPGSDNVGAYTPGTIDTRAIMEVRTHQC